MTAAQTTGHEEDKHSGIRKEKIRKAGSKARKQENRTQGVHSSNKVSRLCYVQSRAGDVVALQLYAVLFLLSSATLSSVSTAAVNPPLREQINENQTKLPVGGCTRSNSGSTF